MKLQDLETTQVNHHVIIISEYNHSFLFQIYNIHHFYVWWQLASSHNKDHLGVERYHKHSHHRFPYLSMYAYLVYAISLLVNRILMALAYICQIVWIKRVRCILKLQDGHNSRKDLQTLMLSTTIHYPVTILFSDRPNRNQKIGRALLSLSCRLHMNQLFPRFFIFETLIVLSKIPVGPYAP